MGILDEPPVGTKRSSMGTRISLLLAVATPIALLACRTWIVARITKGVQHKFDEELEELRTTLRNNEERFKSDLRQKETEIDALRNNVLSGSAGRQTLLDKRRFERGRKDLDGCQ